MNLWHAPSGKLVKGHVLDVDQKSFDEALRLYDPRLYTAWNPAKLGGWGCWEIRLKPTKMTSLHVGTHQGTKYYRLFEIEYDHIHHVLDAAFLNYDAIRKIKEMDMFKKMEQAGLSSTADILERKEEAYRNQIREKAEAELKYAFRHNKTLARDLYETVRSGVDPAQILLANKWALKS